MIHTLQLGQFGLWKPTAVVVDDTPARRNLRMCTVIAHDLHGDLNEDARTGLALTGTASYTTGPAGEANGAVSNGSTSVRFLQTNAAGLNISDQPQPFFVSFFVRRRATSSTRQIWTVTDGTAATRVRIGLDTGGSGSLLFTQTDQTITLSALPLDTYEHIVWSYDGTDHTIYRDSVLSNTTASTSTGTMQFNRWAIGNAINALAADLGFDMAYFVFGHGNIGQDEVTYLYNSGAGRPASDWMTVAYGTTFDAFVSTWSGISRWRLNNSAVEEGGGGSVTLTNGAAYSNAVALPSGLSGTYSVLGDGTNDFVSVPNQDCTTTNELTVVGFWRSNGAITTNDRMFQFGPTTNSTTNARGMQAGASGTVTYATYHAGTATYKTVTSVGAHFPADTWAHLGLISNAPRNRLWGVADGYVAARIDASISPTAVLLDNNGLLAVAQGGGTALNAYVCEVVVKVGTLPFADIAKARDLAFGSG
jgi:hypothetical protein